MPQYSAEHCFECGSDKKCTSCEGGWALEKGLCVACKASGGWGVGSVWLGGACRGRMMGWAEWVEVSPPAAVQAAVLVQTERRKLVGKDNQNSY